MKRAAGTFAVTGLLLGLACCSSKEPRSAAEEDTLTVSMTAVAATASAAPAPAPSARPAPSPTTSAIVDGEGHTSDEELLAMLQNGPTATATTVPKGPPTLGGATITGGGVANAGSVVAGMAAGFRRCFNQALTQDPNARGTLKIRAKIGPNGDVQSATPTNVTGAISPVLASCCAGIVSSRIFDPPDGGSAEITIPVSFVAASAPTGPQGSTP